MAPWTTLLEAVPAAWGGAVGATRAADAVGSRLLPALRRLRRRGHAVDDAAALIETFRAIHAPRAGVAAALITPAGVQRHCMGRSRGRAINAGTGFEIGSITKTFTAALLRDMAHRGDVHLDTPVQQLLPAGLGPAREVPRSLTLADLACHAGGLPRLPPTPRMAAGVLLHPGNPYAWLHPDAPLRWLRGRTLPAVGRGYGYSNLGAGLLGALLARCLDTDLETAWRTRLLEPLGLHDTAVAAQRMPPVARPHRASGLPTPVWRMPAMAGAGALASTLDDMLRWLQAHLQVRPPLHADSIDPRMHIDARRSVGLGWHLVRGSHGRLAWHNGGTGGSRSFAAFDRAHGCGVVVLCNRAIGVDRLGMDLLRLTLSG